MKQQSRWGDKEKEPTRMWGRREVDRKVKEERGIKEQEDKQSKEETDLYSSRPFI